MTDLTKYGDNFRFGGTVILQQDIIDKDFHNEFENLVTELIDAKVVEIAYQIENEEQTHLDTMYVTIDESTDLKKMMLAVTKFRPHEFSEETPNVFRIWVD